MRQYNAFPRPKRNLRSVIFLLVACILVLQVLRLKNDRANKVQLLPETQRQWGTCNSDLASTTKKIHFSKDAGDTVYLLIYEPEEGPDCNIFHVLWGYVAPVRDAINYGVLEYARQRRTPLNVKVVLPECHQWLQLMVQAFPTQGLPVKIQTERTEDFPKYMITQNTTGANCFTVVRKWESLAGGHDYWLANKPGYAARQMRQWTDSMREYYLGSGSTTTGTAITPCPKTRSTPSPSRPRVLFVERSCTRGTRTAIDLETGQPAFPLLVPHAEAMGYDTELLYTCNNNTLQQFESFSRANVVVSVHGAQITNLVFLQHRPHYRCQDDQTDHQHKRIPVGPTLIEVSFRFAWCDPRPLPVTNGSRAVLLEQWQHECVGRGPPLRGSRRFYHKADFFRLATAMGIQYREVMQHSLQGLLPESENPISVKGVVVNSSHILRELEELLLKNHQPAWKSAYNGEEGVHPYRIGRLGLWDTLLCWFKELTIYWRVS